MFFELKPDEKIVICLRRHWFVLTLVLLRLVPLFILPAIAWFFLSMRFDMSVLFAQKLFWLLSSLWWLFVWGGMAVLWVNYYLDFWVVTNQRIISTSQKALFRREVSELSFSRVQDITVKVKGVIKTFINYGDLEVRTAGTFEAQQDTNVFIFQDIPDPYQTQNLLSGLHRNFFENIAHHT
ncbi:MAG: PH domain-containing protein [bacterium]